MVRIRIINDEMTGACWGMTGDGGTGVTGVDGVTVDGCDG